MLSRLLPASASISDAVGKTPLVRLRSVEPADAQVEIWAKLELANPGGSVKDRPALQMILDAESSGRLRPGMSLIDSTSGNTGVALSLFGAARGYHVTLVMPQNVSEARKRIVNAYGAEVIYSDPLEQSDGAIRMVREIVRCEPTRYFYTDQYSNPSNPRAHYLTTAPEIFAELGHRLTHFVAGIGTSGTVIGAGRRFKEISPAIHVVGLEPDDAFHGLEGLKHLASSIVPAIYDPGVLDETLFIDTESGWVMAERLALEEGYLVGYSAGANVEGARRLAERLKAANQTGVIATVLCDHASRYIEARAP